MCTNKTTPYAMGLCIHNGKAAKFTPDIRVDDNDRDEKLSLDGNIKELIKEVGKVVCNLQLNMIERKEKLESLNF